jgi:YHS domain-containing protein
VSTIRRIAFAVIAAALLGATVAAVRAQAPQSPPPINIDKASLAIQGYDPVAYQTLGKPIKGMPEFAAAHDGATYRFASADHKAAFEKDPTKYVPQYGGYCAYAVASGYTASVDPTAWKVVEGKLYLNYNAAVAKSWAANTTGYIKSGDANWIDWRKLKKG